MAEALQALSAKQPRVSREREILRVAAPLSGANEQQVAMTARREVLKWVEKRSLGRLPDDAWKLREYEHLAGGRYSTAARIADDDYDIWAIRADDPDKTVAQRIWTTEATVAFKPNERVLFGVRLLVSSPEPELSIEPAVPGLVQQVASKCGLEQSVVNGTTDPWVIETDDDAEQLIDRLIDPARRVPIFVLTVPEFASDLNKPLVDPYALARATVGIAMVVVVPGRFTWALTERFGKQLSVFLGAARTYLPGFTEDADPYGGHQLFLSAKLSTPSGMADANAWMRRQAATESLRRLRLGIDVISFAAVREESLDRARGRLEQEGAADSRQLAAALGQIRAIKDDLEKALDAQQWLSDEHKTAEDRAITLELQLNSANYRIQQLTDQLSQRGYSPDANISLPAVWSMFADWCEMHLVGRVILSPRARKELKTAAFRDVPAAARCLIWLANDYRKRRMEGGDGDLRINLESGIQNDRCGADGFKMAWRGARANIDWHIKNGGNTRDPFRCLRIYYFWDQADQKVVIASMPAHLETGAS